MYFPGTGTYTGGTTIASGAQLIVGWNGVQGSITGNVVDNGDLLFAPNATMNFAGSISGSGEVDYNGTWNSGTFTLSGNNSFSGTFISEGPSSLILGSATALGQSRLLSLGNTLDLNGYSISAGEIDEYGGIVNNGSQSATVTITAYSSSDLFGVIQDGSSTVGLNANNGIVYVFNADTYSGGTTIASVARLVVGWAGYNGSITGNVVDNGALWFAPTTTTVFNGNVSGSGYILCDGDWNSGTFTLGGNNTLAGGIGIGGGATLNVGSAYALGTGTGSVCLEGGTLNLNGYNVTIASLSIIGGGQNAIVDHGATAATLTVTSTGTTTTYQPT
jgi:hypothetical protein